MTRTASTIGRLCLLVATLAPLRMAWSAQTLDLVERLDFDRPESWAMKYFTTATLMNGLGTPRRLLFGQLRLAVEGGWIPSVSDTQRIVGFNGTKSEDLNKLPVFGRLELTVGLPWWLSLTIGYVPPIEINGVQANLLSVALARPFSLTRHFTLGVSVYAQVGDATGDFTCSQSEVNAGDDRQRNPFGCHAPSHDRLGMKYVGGEVSASYRIDRAHGLEPYTSVAGNFMDLEFRIRAEYDDVSDRTRQLTRGGTFSTASGLLFPITRRLDAVGEVFYSPLVVNRPQNGSSTVEGLLNVRFLIAYRFF